MPEIDSGDTETKREEQRVPLDETWVGPYRIRRSDGFYRQWEAGTTDQDVDSAVQAAIQRALKGIKV